METESTIDDIIKTVQRFRILCVGRSGVGKSSLVNHVFGISEAHPSEFRAGEADIDKEFVSTENEFFVLHDSKGFEPGDNANFDVVSRFIEERCRLEDLKDRLHAIWLCTKTPTAGGRVFEIGDEKLLELAHNKGVPILIVFTQYDKLVRTKVVHLKGAKLTPELKHQRAEAQASEALRTCIESVEKTMNYLRIPLPPHVKVSVRPRFDADVSDLVTTTREIVQTGLKNDAWVLWTIAQRASIPVKIDACIERGLNSYYLALSGAAPGIGKLLLRECLVRVHQDIVTCWNIKNGHEILKSQEFTQLMLYLVQDVSERRSHSSSPSTIDKVNQFVSLVTAASAPIAPAVAILGLSYLFVKWLSDAVLENVPSVESVIMAYAVDLISVLKSLFHFTLMNPDFAEKANWEILKDAFEGYGRTEDLEQNHKVCRSTFHQNNQMMPLNRDAFRAKLKVLLET